jgi:hypothetical protein
MAEEKSTPTDEAKSLITPDLRIVVEGTDKRIFIKDKDGVEHRLMPLTLADVIDFEDNIGVSIYEIAKAEIKMKNLIHVLYLSLRKSGCTKDEIRERRYKMKERDVQEMFDLSFLKSAIPIFADILAISGFKNVNPQKPTSPEDSTPGKE